MRKTVVGLLVFLCCCNAASALLAQELEPEKRRKRNLFIGFGVGVAGYWPDTAGLYAAFTAIENYFRDQGWYIPGRTNFTASPLVTYSVRVQLASPIGLVVEAGQSTTDDKIDALSATALFDFGRIRDSKLRPYIGVGVTDVSFEFTRVYNARISEGTYYTTLDHITASGSASGASFVGGVQIEFLRVRFLFHGAYWWIPELSDDFGTGVTTTVNLSSFLVGAQFMLTFP